MTIFVLALLLLQNPNSDSVIAKIGIDQNLNRTIDLDIPFQDEVGRAVTLRDYFGQKPVILTPVYYACPMLCTELLNALVRALHVLPFTAGKEFEIVSFSIDANEHPALALSKKAHYVRDYGRPGVGDGWHFLTGSSEAITKLTNEIGFRYTYDGVTKQWAHASAIMILTPDGKLSQYWNGIEFDPGDLKLSLMNASGGKIGSVVDHILMYCYQYDATTGKYSLMVLRIVQLCSIALLFGLAAFVLLDWKRRKLKLALRARAG